MSHLDDDPDEALHAALASSFAASTRRSGAYIGSLNVAGRGLDRLAAFGQVIIIAAAFGAGPRADLYFLAAIAPLAIGTIIGDPLGRGFLTLVLGTRDPTRARALAASGLAVSTAFVVFVTACYLAVAYMLVRELTPVGSGDFTPWLAFGLLAPALGLSGYLGGVLLFLELYGWDAARIGSASIVGLIGLGAVAGRTDSVAWAAAAITFGYVVSVVVTLVVIGRRLGFGWFLHGTREGLRTALRAKATILSPIAGGIVGNPVIVMIERVFAATIGTGAVATLSYARGIAAAPAMLSQAIGSGAYPGLVRADADGQTVYLRRSFLAGLRLNLFVGSVFGLYVGIFGSWLSIVLLQRGSFEAASAGRAADALAAFALSTLATSVLMYVIPVLYGIGGFSGILFRSLAVFGAYVVLAPLLLLRFHEIGLAVAFSLAQMVGATLAVVLAARRLGFSLRELWIDSVWPTTRRVAVVAATLVGYRLVLPHVPLPIAWVGIARVGGSALLLAVASAIVLLTARSPESQRLRELGSRALRRGR